MSDEALAAILKALDADTMRHLLELACSCSPQMRSHIIDAYAQQEKY